MNKLTIIALMLLCSPLWAQSHKLDFTAGYNFQNSDQGSGVRSNLNGWFSSLSFDVTPVLSINLEVDNYYGSSHGASVKKHNFVIDPQFTFGSEEAKLRPLAYVKQGTRGLLPRGMPIIHSTCRLEGCSSEIERSVQPAICAT
jgi:hypothetical protein